MKIEIKNFYSLKQVSLELNEGISVIAGKNGSGKSQLLAAIVGTASKGPGGLNERGLPVPRDANIRVDPTPEKPLWRPPVRRVAESTRNQEFTPITDTKGQVTFPDGHVRNLDQRYTNLHARLCNIFLAGDTSSAKEIDKELWENLRGSFKDVFQKELRGEYERNGRGAKIGLALPNEEVSTFGQLSTGELEYISLLSDILTEPDADMLLIDEIEAHFHPDLQRRVLDEIAQFCNDRIVLVSTQSPAVMLAADPERLFFIHHSSDVDDGENQVTRVATDPELFDSLRELYPGFSTDVRMMKHLEVFKHRELLCYAAECGRDSDVKESQEEDSDPQVGHFRAMLLGVGKNATLVEHGVGKGRMLSALTRMDTESLSTLSYHAVDLDPEREQDVLDYYAEIDVELKDFQFHASLPTDVTSDLAVLANVLHEVGPDRMAEFLSTVLRQARRGSKVLVLEVLELDVGEKRFVVFGKEALDALFASCVKSGALEVSIAEPKSHGGRPLLEAVLIVRNPDAASITDEDVIRALHCVVDAGGKVLAQSLNGSEPLQTRPLAFHCHNVANAVAFGRLLSDKRNSN
ncbi:MAG: AAA family ATPase [Thermoguttaceae bacterium]